MPELGRGTWLNTATPLNRELLRGRVVLVDFWDYTCINCIRTLPYLNTWYRRYADQGLVIIGVHAPEFRFGRAESQVEAAIRQYEIAYPVLLDNDYVTWEHFANRAWPTKHLIDAQGYIRYVRRGEGYYRLIESAIQQLLYQRDPTVSLPDLLPPLREEDSAGAVCYRPTPELHAGYAGGGLFGGALGNPEGYVTGSPMAYVLPGPFDMQDGHFYLSGFWRTESEAIVFAGQDGGRVVVPYQAAGVYAVLSPSSDLVEIILDLRPAHDVPLVEVCQDDEPLSPDIAGKDIYFDEHGRSLVAVSRPRMYELVRNYDFESHELDLKFHTHGVAIYAFSFTSCLAAARPRDDQTGDFFVVQ